MSIDLTALTPYTVGEKPEPLTYTFTDGDGVAIPLTGYTAEFVWQPLGGAATTTAATVSGAAGWQVTYSWTGAELAVAGHYLGEVWVGNTVNRFASELLLWTVRQSVGLVPAI